MASRAYGAPYAKKHRFQFHRNRCFSTCWEASQSLQHCKFFAGYASSGRFEVLRFIPCRNDNRIYLYGDKLVVTFNHKDGAETITLNDIEAALAEAENGSDLVSFAVPKFQIPIWVSGILFLSEGTRTIKCKAPVEPCLPPVSTAATPYFAPKAQRQRVPFGVLPINFQYSAHSPAAKAQGRFC